MNRRGQVTIFIIIALVIIVSVAGYFTYKNQIVKSPLEVSSDKVSTYVIDCLEKTSEVVVYGVGQGGGFFYPTIFSTDLGIAYYYLDNENLMPSLERIENEISEVISEKIFECTNNFTDFTNNYQISQGKIKTITEIRDEKIYINLEYPIRIIKGEEVIMLKDFNYKLDVDFERIYSVAHQMISIEKEKQGICLTCNAEIALQNHVTIEMLDYERFTTIFVIKDEDLKINEKVFEFVFANDYSDGL